MRWWTRSRRRAYPRGRGGTVAFAEALGGQEGLSPRTRGNHLARVGHHRPVGPIPADAGEPRSCPGPCRAAGAYPRGRGGTNVEVSGLSLLQGLSPRTRGNRIRVCRSVGAGGPIPADAGEPAASTWKGCTSRAYPRGRGGTNYLEEEARPREGLSPRTRGNPGTSKSRTPTLGPIPADAGEPDRPRRGHPQTAAYPRGRGGTGEIVRRELDSEGLSPRTRGNRRRAHLARILPGPIPADAGEPASCRVRLSRCRAYPRGRGGTGGVGLGHCGLLGLSPRTRGNHQRGGPCRPRARPIPADAGEPQYRRRRLADHGAYPRGRGGTTRKTDAQGRVQGLSPRTRGNPEPANPRKDLVGPIPADAGEPGRDTRREIQQWAYPRGRGGTLSRDTNTCDRVGLSPRTRGNPSAICARTGTMGPIPADAGEPGRLALAAG